MTTRLLRRALAAAVTVALTVVVLGALAVAGLVAGERSQQARPTGVAHAAPTAAGRPVVVAFVLGSSGTVASDLLAPFDVFASSRAVTAYVVAADPGPAVLDGGPAVVPTYTFEQVDADPALRPDLVVVPAIDDPTGASERPLRDWVSARYHAGARVLGVCAGARVLAATGILDGRSATSHWSRLPALERAHPEVRWVRGRRWVDDGPVSTTAAITSGVPGALHALATLVGTAEARRVAFGFAEFGWTPARSPVIDADGWQTRDWPVALNLVEPWLRPTIGVRLKDGVGELDAAAPFEVLSQSGAGRAIAVSEGHEIRTRHGLTLLTTTLAEAPKLSRTVTPGGFGAALNDLARHTNHATAVSTAKMMGYPLGHDLLAGDQSPSWRPLLLGAGSVVLAVLIGRAPLLLAHRRRRAQ